MSNPSLNQDEEPIPEPIYNDSEYNPPKEFRVYPGTADDNDIKAIISLIDKNCPEREIDRFLSAHKELLGYIISAYSTGHQGCWVVPKKVIKTKGTKTDKGLIPDFIIGGQSTSGKEWFIVELKGVDEKWFIEKGTHIYFSSTINKGIHQLIEYLDHCDTYQNKFRDEYKLTDFKKPKAILIAGKRSEFEGNARKKSIKQEWQRLLGSRLQIITYDTLKTELERRLRDSLNLQKQTAIFNPFAEPLDKLDKRQKNI